MGDDLYAVDNDKRWDVEENVLSDLVSQSRNDVPQVLTLVLSGTSHGENADE